MNKGKPDIRKRDILTRAKAERLLSSGLVNPTEERFTKHQNKHVRAKAARLIAQGDAASNEMLAKVM